MYQIYIEQLSGLRFVEDEDVVTMKLAVLNNEMCKNGYLDADRFYKTFDLEPQFPDVKFLVAKNMMFMFRPTFVGDVPVVAIGIEKVDY